jgi:hypothetical protein
MEYFVENINPDPKGKPKYQQKKVFEINVNGTNDAEEANKEFIVYHDEKTGEFKVHPVIKRKNSVFVAMIDGEYNFVGNSTINGKVTYVEVPILGKKNISNIYAATLNEAITISKQSRKRLEEIEKELSKEDQAAIEENANTETQEEKVDTDELLNGEAEGELLQDFETEEVPQGDGFSEEIPFTEADVDELAKRLSRCNKVAEDTLIEYIFKTLEEARPDKEIDRDEKVPEVKAELAQETENVLSSMPIRSDAITEATRRQILINNLVEVLKSNIKSGKTKVYTNLTKEEIC